MSRWILADDTDSDIIYVGPWFADKGSQDALGNFGPPYLSTLHGVNSPASFKYTFRGSRVLITSTVQFPTVGNLTNPSFQCIVDGTILESILYTTAQNRLRLCEADGLDDNNLHTITVRVDVSNNHTFWLDYIQYLPFPDTPIDTAAISIDTTDAEILFGGWTSKYPGYITQSADSTFSFEFFGISLIWLGFYDNSLPMDLATATYSIDGQAPVSFNLNGALAKATGVQYNQVFFEIPQLEAKTHTLKVSYQGDISKTPLSLYILEVQNGTSSLVSTGPSSATSTGPGTTTTTSGGSNSTSSLPTTASKSTTPAIIGGVVGGLCLLIIVCIVVIIFLRRRRRTDNQYDDSPQGDPPMEQIINPFPSPHIPSDPVSDPGPSLAPLRPLYLIPPMKNAHIHIQSGYSNSDPTSSSNSKHAPQNSQSTSALSYTSGSHQASSTPIRDVDSGVRFQAGNLPVLPPGYTAA